MNRYRTVLHILVFLSVFIVCSSIVRGGPGKNLKTKKALITSKLNTLVSHLPILPPDKASQPFDSTLKISGLPVDKFLALLSRKPFLDMNMVIASSSKALDNPVEIFLNDMTVGEVFNLVLQLNGLAAIRFNKKTLIIVDKDQESSYGIKQRKSYTLRYWMPTKMKEFIDDDDFLKEFFKNANFIVNDVQRNILIIGSQDEITLFDYIVDLLDQKPNKIHARIPLNNIEFDDLKSKLGEMLPEDLATAIDTNRWVYSEQGRSVLIYDDPETVSLLKQLVKIIDIPPKQVLIDIALMEVSENFSKEIGMKLGSSSFQVDSLDKLFSMSRLRNYMAANSIDPAPVTISYLMQRNGGRTLASPKVRVLDGESADINIGEIRNIRVQSTEFTSTTGSASQQTSYNTQEVPIGVQLNVKPEIYNDGTVKLELSISDEAIIAIQEYGVDRTTRNSTTVLRIKDGETVIMGGFINQQRDWDRTPIPILGQLPLIGRLFRAGKRTKLATELVFLITPYILDFEKDTERSFANKTINDIKPGSYTKNLGTAKVSSTTTKWLKDEQAGTKTKMIFDATGKLIYKQTWSSKTGKPIGEALDLRDKAKTVVTATPVNTSASLPADTGEATVPESGSEESLPTFEDLLGEPSAPPQSRQSRVPSRTAPASAAPSPTPGISAPPPLETAPAAVSNANTQSTPEAWDSLLDKLDGVLGGKGA